MKQRRRRLQLAFCENAAEKMSYMKLIKLLYLADREALARWGRPITTDHYVSMDKGPVLSHVLDCINEGPGPDIKSYWAQHIAPSSNYEVTLSAIPDGELLSEAEDELLDEIFEKHGHLSRWAIVDLVHGLPNWHDPDGRAIPIGYDEILRAFNKAPRKSQPLWVNWMLLARVEGLCV